MATRGTWTRLNIREINARPDAVWAVVADMPSWPRWDPAVASVTVEVPVARGTRGRLRPTGRLRGAIHARLAKPFTIGEFQAGVALRMDQPVPAGVMSVRLAVSPATGEASSLAQEVTVSGPLAALTVRIIAAEVVDSFATSCAAIERLARVQPEGPQRTAG